MTTTDDQHLQPDSDQPDVDLRRLILQTLESWNSAGISHLSAVTVPAPVINEPITVPTNHIDQSEKPLEIPRVQADTSEPVPQAKTNVPMAKKPQVPAKTTRVLIPDDASDGKEPVAVVPVLSRDERVIQLKVLSDRVSQCTRCDELARTRTQTVFGVGNPQARVVFIGEAPGADEDEQGEPFVGRAGKLLNDIIKAMKLTREEIYICNILRCRPPGNRTPAPDEAANCREYLDGQLRIVNPEFIICWGSCAAQNLLGMTDSIGKMRGKWFRYNSARVLCTYHPSYLLRNPPAKKDVWEDMKLVMKELGIPVP